MELELLGWVLAPMILVIVGTVRKNVQKFLVIGGIVNVKLITFQIQMVQT